VLVCGMIFKPFHDIHFIQITVITDKHRSFRGPHVSESSNAELSVLANFLFIPFIFIALVLGLRKTAYW
jgi:hypothetical protein